MARAGRPKAENPLCAILSVRFDQNTIDGINEYCLEHNVSTGKAVRQAVHMFVEKNKKQADDYQS